MARHQQDVMMAPKSLHCANNAGTCLPHSAVRTKNLHGDGHHGDNSVMWKCFWGGCHRCRGLWNQQSQRGRPFGLSVAQQQLPSDCGDSVDVEATKEQGAVARRASWLTVPLCQRCGVPRLQYPAWLRTHPP